MEMTRARRALCKQKFKVIPLSVNIQLKRLQKNMKIIKRIN